jgi:hypothetical protein
VIVPAFTLVGAVNGGGVGARFPLGVGVGVGVGVGIGTKTLSGTDGMVLKAGPGEGLGSGEGVGLGEGLLFGVITVDPRVLMLAPAGKFELLFIA